MNVVHRVTGFDKRTEMIEREFDVPAELVPTARRMAEAPARWEDAPASFPLDGHAVRALAMILNAPMDADRYDWFLEPYAD